jgi:CBS domain-containing protein
MSLKGAAHLLWQSQVSGAPVVDEEGRCVGVLSSMDFVHLAEEEKKHAMPEYHRCEAAFTSSQIMDPEAAPTCQVCDVMDHDPVLASPSTNIGELSQMMRDAHIHRVIVCDGEGRPLGLVSSMDIISAVAQTYQVEQHLAEAVPS